MSKNTKLLNIALDINNPSFQEDLFRLQKQEQLVVLKTLNKLFHMNWQQLYQDPGFKWEQLHSKIGPAGQKIYSLRLSKGFRALAYREENLLRFLALHPDHDNTYQ